VSAQDLVTYLSTVDSIASESKNQAYTDMDFSGFYTATITFDGTSWALIGPGSSSHPLLATDFDDAIAESDDYIRSNGGLRITSFKVNMEGNYSSLASDGILPPDEHPAEFNQFLAMTDSVSGNIDFSTSVQSFAQAGITMDGLDHWQSSFSSDGGYPSHDLVADISDESGAKAEAQEYWESLGHRMICGWSESANPSGYGPGTWLLI